MSPKVAVITGASSGIGRESAIALSAAGWCLALTARRLEQLEETKTLCSSSAVESDSCIVLAGEITDEAFVKKLFEETVAKFGRLDMLFNNAGMSSKGTPIDEISLKVFTAVLNVNLVGSFLCTREAFKIFKSQSPTGGRIINNGSLAARVPRPHAAPYTCSKHAITGLTKAAAIDGRNWNIAVTQIDIGNALTEMAAGQTRGVLQPDGRVMVEATFDPVHVAETIVHIASLPNSVTVLEMNIMATGVPFVGRG